MSESLKISMLATLMQTTTMRIVKRIENTYLMVFMYDSESVVVVRDV